jgi:hypothetical protein
MPEANLRFVKLPCLPGEFLFFVPPFFEMFEPLAEYKYLLLKWVLQQLFKVGGDQV